MARLSSIGPIGFARAWAHVMSHRMVLALPMGAPSLGVVLHLLFSLALTRVARVREALALWAKNDGPGGAQS